MKENEIRSKILGILNKPDTEEVTNEMDLGLDSIDFVRVVIGIEDAFDVEFDEFDLNIESFKTISDFIKYINVMMSKT